MAPTDPTPDVPSSGTALTRALRSLLRPLVRLLLARQVTYPALTALLKELYVEVADRDFRLPDKRQTDSRVSLLSGVHRKEVSRLRNEPPAEDEAPRSVSLGSLIVARWLAVDDYLDGRGRPRPLARQPAAAQEEAGFEQLVRSVSKDIRPRAVLDEWLRLGIARIDEQDRVCLETESFVPEKGFDEKAYYFGRNLRDHIAAGAHNLEGEGEPFIDRSVYYAKLSAASTRELAALAEEHGMAALRAVNRRALELQRRDAEGAVGPEGTARRRINFGVYFFEAPTSEDEGAAPASPAGGDDDEQA